VDDSWRQQIIAELPELPEARRARLVTQYGITEYDAATLTSSARWRTSFEEAAAAAKNPKRVANLVQGELMGRLKAKVWRLSSRRSRWKVLLCPLISSRAAPSAAKFSKIFMIWRLSAAKTSCHLREREAATDHR